jgi:glycosyltransferase involved in cell wall biosynthesis
MAGHILGYTRMRILYVTTVAVTIRAFLLPFISHYRKLGARVDVAANGVSGPEWAQLCDMAYDLEWRRSIWSLPRALRDGFKIRRIVTQGQYDIVHVHTPIAAFCTRLSLIGLAGKKPVVIYTAHGFRFHAGGNPITNAVWRAAEKLAGRWTDYLIVINKEDAARAEASRLVSRNHVIHMPGIGVDTGELTPHSISDEAVRRFRESLRLVAGQQLFLMSARFNPEKRHTDALRAFARLADQNCHLALAGDGPLVEPIRLLADELGVAKRVHFLGFRNDMPVCIKASVALLLPSDREGLPRSIMEAFCLGTPVIATDIRGSRELVDGNGVLVPVGDVEALAAAMQYIRDNPAEAARKAARASEFISQYDISTVIGMHDLLYTQAVGNPGETTNEWKERLVESRVLAA